MGKDSNATSDIEQRRIDNPAKHLSFFGKAPCLTGLSIHLCRKKKQKILKKPRDFTKKDAMPL